MFYIILRTIWFAILWIDLALFTILMYLLGFLPDALTKSWYPGLFRRWCRTFIRAFGAKLHVHQQYAHDLPKQYIVIANHPSAFEDVGMPATFAARFIAKIELGQWFLVGRISQAARCIYVDRDCSDSRSDTKTAIKKALSEGDNVAIYPEGGCKGRRIQLPFRWGIFTIAHELNMPIVPAFIHYESQADFEWANQHLVKKLIQLLTSDNKTAHYYIFEAITPSDFKTPEDLCEHVQNLYLKWQEKYLE